MDPIRPEHMRRILDVTDALGIHRESVRVPLARQGAGSARVLPDGRLEIVAPLAQDLDSWLHDLPQRLSALDLSRVRRAG